MKSGIVKFYKAGEGKGNGWGFITNDDNGKDIYVHATGLVDSINKNDKVTFDLRESKLKPGKWEACNVRIAA